MGIPNADRVTQDRTYLRRAVQLALQAEAEGNLPIGAVIVLDGAIVAEGYNHIWAPVSASTRHAEMEALRAVDPALWPRAREMALYTTLEPCMMCTGAIMLHHIGRLVFGAGDDYGGLHLAWRPAGQPAAVAQWPPYFHDAYTAMRWEGPALLEECDELLRRVMVAVKAHDGAQSQI